MIYVKYLRLQWDGMLADLWVQVTPTLMGWGGGGRNCVPQKKIAISHNTKPRNLCTYLETWIEKKVCLFIYFSSYKLHKSKFHSISPIFGSWVANSVRVESCYRNVGAACINTGGDQGDSACSELEIISISMSSKSQKVVTNGSNN